VNIGPAKLGFLILALTGHGAMFDFTSAEVGRHPAFKTATFEFA
jgi:hypothetical protein